MRPVVQADGHDRPRLIDKLVPGVAAVVEDILVRLEYPVGEPVVADELPDVFGRIELGRFGRQRHQGDVVGNGELVGEMPAGLIEQSTAWQPGSTAWEISARCSAIAAVLQRGRTRPAAVPRAGQIAPKRYAGRVR